MRDPNRIPEVIQALFAAWAAHPDLRLGQLVSNASNDYDDIFYVTDEEILDGLRRMVHGDVNVKKGR